MAWQQGPFRFMTFKEWVPDKIRFWIYILFLIAFQFSNGMYFTAMSQMQGSLSITMDDVKMMSHGVLIGLTMYFPIAFRMKSRFPNKTNIIIAASGLMICNLIVPHIDIPFLLVIIGFIAGFFRLYGTFECFSNIIPKITPTYNYGIFLSFVFFVVLGVIHVFDAISIHLIYHYDWQHLHRLAIGLMLLVIMMAKIMMSDFRTMPLKPLYAMDWLGMILWSIFILSLIFVAQYAYQLEFLHSPYIRMAVGTACITLAMNLIRMKKLRHPFIEFAAFKTKRVPQLLIAFLFLGILLASKNVLQNTFTNAVLHLDALNAGRLKWFEFIGALSGAVFSFYALIILKWKHKTVASIGFTSVTTYVAMMYFLISPDTNIEKLYLPLIICNFGHLCIFIALTVFIQATAPFRNYFQILCVLGFIRTGIASPIGDCIYQHGINGLMGKHLSIIGSEVNISLLDSMNRLDTIGVEAMSTTLTELYGYTFIFGLIVLMLILILRKPAINKDNLCNLRNLWLEKLSRRTNPAESVD